MERVSFLLVLTAVIIIVAVLLMFLRIRRIAATSSPRDRYPLEPPLAEETLDPLFATEKVARAMDDQGEGTMAWKESESTALQSMRASRESASSRPGRPIPAFIERRSDLPSQTEPAAPALVSAAERAYPEQRSIIPRVAPRIAEDPSQVVALSVVASRSGCFRGRELHAAFEQCGLEYGAWEIFHYYVPEMLDMPPYFSVANLLKPGTLNPMQMDDLSTTGLSLFMVSAGTAEDLEAFDVMLTTARGLAAQLGGEVRDARRSILTRQAVEHLRAQISDRSRKIKALHP